MKAARWNKSSLSGFQASISYCVCAQQQQRKTTDATLAFCNQLMDINNILPLETCLEYAWDMHKEVEHRVSPFSKHSWPNHHFWISCRDGICCGAELVDLWFTFHYLSIIIYLLSLTFYLFFFCILGEKKKARVDTNWKPGVLFKWECNFKLNRFLFFFFFIHS